MKQKIAIQERMSLCPHSIGLEQNASLARSMMRKFDIRHLPVQSGGKLVGVVSDRDIGFALGWAKNPEGELQIKDIYTPEPYIVSPETPLVVALDRMVQDHIGCTLVEANGKLVGIFTTTDACRVLAEDLRTSN